MTPELPLPYGIFDLDPQLLTDRGPPLRVRCVVQGCTELLRPPTRNLQGEVCPDHGIRVHHSGTSVTYTFEEATRNLIVAPDLFQQKLRRNPHKFETHRFGYEKSEDALTWNVFRSLQEAGCLHEVSRLITGLDIREEPILYLWGLNMTDDSLRLWNLLRDARRRFESALPVKRPGTEPDIGLHLPGNYLILIEAKFTSSNTYYANGGRKDAASLTKDELIDIYHDPNLQILDPNKAKEAELVYYQLWRNLIFAEWMAREDSMFTQAYHANLVRAGYEHNGANQFSQLVRPEFADRFARITWEQLFVLASLHWRDLTRMIEYMIGKTAGLAPAFQLDIG